MEDKLTNQEEQLKVLTEDFSLDIDTSELWDKVEAQLPPLQREKRRPIVWWFASGALVILFGFLVWNILSKESPVEALTDHSSLSSSPNKIQNSIDTYTKHTYNSPINTTSSKSIIPQTNEVNTEKASSTNINHVNIEAKEEKSSTIFNSNRYDEKSSIRKEVLINQGTIDQESIASLINPSSDFKRDFDPLETLKERDFISIQSLSIGDLSALEYEFEIYKPQMKIEPVRSVRWLPYYSFYSGANLHKSKIYSNANEGFNLTQFENESPLVGLSTSLHLGRESNNGWRYGIGLNHSMLVNRFTQTQPDTVVTNVVGNTTSKIDDEGNINHLTGDLVQTTITKHNLKWHRKHDYVNLQLHLGRRIFRKGNLTMFTDANLSRNIWSKHTGYYFKEGEKGITRFTSNEDNPYSNAGYSVGLSVDIEYKLNDFSISLRPFTNLGLNSIVNNSNYYQIKNSQYGVQLGVVYRP